MSTLSTVTDRNDGEILTAAKYNADHNIHETNASALNTDKLESTLTATLDFDGRDAQDIRHAYVQRFVEFLEASTTPDTPPANRIRFGATSIDGRAELVAVDEAGNVRQISGGQIYDPANVAITGGSIRGITDLSTADGGTGASTSPDARTNIGVTQGLRVMRVYAANDTWTKPANFVRVKAMVVAGGGGGGGAGTSTNAVGGGGGGGGTSIKVIEAASLGATETVTIGNGGTAGASSGGNGGTGGTSSFGAHLSATGGAGGQGTALASNTDGGDGGVGSSGDVNLKGSAGDKGRSLTGTGGNGGDSSLGGGGAGSFTGEDGDNGGNYGGGGGGARWFTNDSLDHAGGAGAPGIVIVEEMY